jgi:Ca2+:H+ antiporter
VARSLYKASLAFAPLVLFAEYALHVSGTTLFVLAACALIPLAYLIGEATEHIAEHTGSKVGGFLNASFGNAPELLIALFAISDSLPNVVRGTIAGSIVSTALLVLGAAMAFGGGGKVDRSSLNLQLGILFIAVTLFLIPSIPGWGGNPNSHTLYLLTLPVAALLLVLYAATITINLRRPSQPSTSSLEHPWSVKRGLTALTFATVATAFVSEALVGSLDDFVEQLGLSQFFVAVVIVALVGNAAEHGGAIVTARRGNHSLGAEIAVSSSAQVAVFVAPAIALLSGLIGRGLTLAFRPVEIATMAIATIAVTLVVADAHAKRWEGIALILGYAAAVVAYWVAGDA